MGNKDFFKKQKMKELITIKPTLQKKFKECLSGRKKMIPDGNRYLHKVKMRT